MSKKGRLNSFKTCNQPIPKIIEQFLKRHIIVKTQDFTIEGTLKHVDAPREHNPGLGNLILEDCSIIRGSCVQAICMEKK